MPHDEDRAGHQLAKLLGIMARLRDPETGCPWDVKQTYRTIAPYTIEEAYEVADAIERGDMADLKDELGDLLLQVVYLARIAEEDGQFAFADVAEAVSAKMTRRHPHVFGDAKKSEDHAATWDAIKAQERAEKAAAGKSDVPASILEGIPAGLPAFSRSAKIQKRVAGIGFEWPDVASRVAKLDEEVAELKAEIAADDPEAQERRFAEFGDVLFVMVNIGMALKIDAEAALRAANAKFERRFRAVEQLAASTGGTLAELSLADMDALWTQAKRSEQKGAPSVPEG
jgi:MazG family protein